MSQLIKRISLCVLLFSLAFLIGYRHCRSKGPINANDQARVAQAGPTGRPYLSVPQTASRADAIQSMPRVEPDRQAGLAPSENMAEKSAPRASLPQIEPSAENVIARSAERTRRRSNKTTRGEFNETSDKAVTHELSGVFRRQFGFMSRSRNWPTDASPNYEEEIKRYDKALALDPAQPDILIKKAQALNRRGLYRLILESRPEEAADARSLKARDFEEARQLTERALELISRTTATAGPSSQSHALRLTALQTRTVTTRLFVTYVDATKLDAGKKAYEEYFALETDDVKKLNARRELAGMLRQIGRLEEAKTEYEKVLAESPNDARSLQDFALTLHQMAELKKRQGDEAGATADYQKAAEYFSKSQLQYSPRATPARARRRGP